jgi:RimJ/RimL family protein N-acetyltransferase
MSSGTETVEITEEAAERTRAGFINGDTLKVIPARRNAKLVVFAWLAERFDREKRYPEAEVNRLLAKAHPDVATLRRGLYDEHFVDRADGIYWRTPDEQRLRIRTARTNPLLSSPRLTLEPLTAAHADELFAELTDPDVLTYVDSAPPPTVAALREQYRRLESRRSPDGTEEWLNWAVMLDGHAIGFVQATVRAGERITLGYGFGRAHWSQGYGTEAVRTMVDYLTSQFPKARLDATVDERNIASVRLLERIGLKITDRSDPRNLRLEGPGMMSPEESR